MQRFFILASLILLCVAGLFYLDVLPAAAQKGMLKPSFGCLPNASPEIAPTLPADSVLTEQPEVNCFAWQQFIALNWKASSTRRGQPDNQVGPEEFGRPGVGPVTWETYKNTTDLFLEDGEEPKPWNTPLDVTAACGADHGLNLTQGRHVKILELTAKFHDRLSHQQVRDNINEAGVAPPAFLMAQSGRLVHYEVLVNEDYFNYIVDPNNTFYDARAQAAAVLPGGQGVNLPVGPSPYGPTGAIELKAGWLELDPNQVDRYLTAEAVIVSEQGSCRLATVGLVGLHIVHKTRTMPNWTWATFEHIETAPNRVEDETRDLHPPYLFYNPKCPEGPICRPQLDAEGNNLGYIVQCPLHCRQNRKPEASDAVKHRIQVVRDVPIPAYVKQLNLAVWELIKEKAGARSVFQNYRLVNTMWPQSGEEIPVGAKTPLSQGGAAPTTGLSNVTAETYAQNRTCLSCHQSATIACSSLSGPEPVYASDYSFQLSRASQPNRPAFCGSKGN